MSGYPTSLDSALTTSDTHGEADTRIRGLQSTLGVSPQGTASTVAERLARGLWPSPGDLSVIAWTAPLAGLASSGKVAHTAGKYFLNRVRLPAGVVTNVSFGVSIAGVGTVTNTNTVAMYDASGNKVAETADLSTTWNSTGFKTVAFTSPYTVASLGYFYIGALTSFGTTNPNIGAMQTDTTAGILQGLGTSSTRLAYVSGTGITAWPSTVTYTSLTAQANVVWFALS